MRLVNVLILVCLLFVFYFSWIPSPRLAQLGFMPTWLTSWADTSQNENLRTAVPLLLLGLLIGFWLAYYKIVWFGWLIAWVCLIGIVLMAELGQILLPLRHFDWGDVGWGAIGALVGMGMVRGVVGLRKAIEKAD